MGSQVICLTVQNHSDVDIYCQVQVENESLRAELTTVSGKLLEYLNEYTTKDFRPEWKEHLRIRAGGNIVFDEKSEGAILFDQVQAENNKLKYELDCEKMSHDMTNSALEQVKKNRKNLSRIILDLCNPIDLTKDCIIQLEAWAKGEHNG